MGLSSNSIIHFTRNKTALKGILEDNFKLKYCRESIKFDSDSKGVPFGVPMVSFCDIPLSQIKDHIDSYGNYGIGLTKEWATQKKLNPVLYLQRGSFLAKSIAKVILEYRRGEKELSIEDEELLNIIRYAKNYEDDLTRKEQKIKNYRFSDEREWRYVPPADGTASIILGTSTLGNPELKRKADGKLSKLRLVFEPDDIRYIIIKDESEIGYFVDVLRRAKGKNYPAHAIERLSTRIITASQIKTDF